MNLFLSRRLPAILLFICLTSAGVQSGSCQPASAAPPTTTEDTKPCFQCNGTGQFKCSHCKNGKVPCPGPCLKLTTPGWVHHDEPGHPPTDIWMFYPSGEGYNQNHVGHVIALKDGHYEDTGPCRICRGKGVANCTVCKGTGEVPCPICDGKKIVPKSWTAFDNPKLKNRPNLIRLKNGSNIFGKIIMTAGASSYISTEDGKSVEVNTSDILPKDSPTETK